MSKKGQLSVFLIAGIVVLLFAALFFWLVSSRYGNLEQSKDDFSNVRTLKDSVSSYVRSCLNDVSLEATYFIAKQGGYYELSSFSDSSLLLPYYWSGSDSFLISKETLEQQFSSYVNDGLFFCLRNFVPFKERGYSITGKKIDTKTTIDSQKIHVNLLFPIILGEDGTQSSSEKFSVVIDSRLGTIHDLIATFFEQQMKEKNALCLDCLALLASQNDLRIEVFNSEDTTILFRITDTTSTPPLVYKFLGNYSLPQSDISQT